MKKPIFRAGIIPYIIEDDQIKLMFMRPSDPKFGTDFLQICKGHVEEGETNEVAALREGNEELGLFEGNIVSMTNLGTFMGRTSLFLAKIKDKTLFGDPHFETKEVRWMTPDEFYAEGRDLHKPIIRSVQRLIKENEGIK